MPETKPPYAIEKFVQDQQDDVLEDLKMLVPAVGKVRALMQQGDPGRAAAVLRAWSGMAMSAACRLEFACAYAAGACRAVEATQSPAEAAGVATTVAAAAAIAQRAAADASSAPRRPSNGGSNGPAPKQFDCGPLGLLTAQEMADRAGVHPNAIYRRLRKGETPIQACRRSRVEPPSGTFLKLREHVAHEEPVAL